MKSQYTRPTGIVEFL